MPKRRYDFRCTAYGGKMQPEPLAGHVMANTLDGAKNAITKWIKNKWPGRKVYGVRVWPHAQKKKFANMYEGVPALKEAT